MVPPPYLSSQTLVDHIALWLVIATPTGVAGEFLGSWLLAAMFVKSADGRSELNH